MSTMAKAQTLKDLRAAIAGIEKHPIAEEVRETGAAGGARPWAAMPGHLWEIWSPEQRDAGAAAGFALGSARGLVTATRPALLFLQLAHEAGERGVPYGPGLAAFGIDPERLVLGRLARITDLLWAIEEAIACRAVAAVVADVGGAPRALDFTVSRRLNLRAQRSGGAIFMTRYGAGREASAAAMRWRVGSAPSAAVAFDRRAPGAPRVRVTLEKGAGVTGAGREWLLEWTEHGWDRADRRPAAGRTVAGPASHGALPAALGDRLPETG